MKITNLIVKGGNFKASVSGEVLESKLQALVESGVDYEAERQGMSKVFKGVEKRNSVAYSADMAANFTAKLTAGLTSFFTAGTLVVETSAREWSAGAGKQQASAQAAYDEMLILGMTPAQALSVAKKVMPTFEPTAAKVEAIAAPAAETVEETPVVA